MYEFNIPSVLVAWVIVVCFVVVSAGFVVTVVTDIVSSVAVGVVDVVADTVVDTGRGNNSKLLFLQITFNQPIQKI